jgi:hypothetical protein
MSKLSTVKDRNNETTSRTKPFIWTLCFLAVTGCAVTLPVVVVEPDGHTFSGTTTAALSGGHFKVTYGHTTCGGTYNALDTSQALTIPVVCSDGRAGRITALRDPSGTSGRGTVKLSDGSVGRFAFGSRVAELEALRTEPHALPTSVESPRERWNACLQDTASRKSGDTSVADVMRTLRSACSGDWEAVLAERCASMDAAACAIFREKMSAVRLQEERQAAAETVQR